MNDRRGEELAGCTECGRVHSDEGIGGYYSQVRCNQAAARRAWERSAEYPRRGELWEQYIQAGDCGD